MKSKIISVLFIFLVILKLDVYADNSTIRLCTVGEEEQKIISLIEGPLENERFLFKYSIDNPFTKLMFGCMHMLNGEILTDEIIKIYDVRQNSVPQHSGGIYINFYRNYFSFTDEYTSVMKAIDADGNIVSEEEELITYWGEGELPGIDSAYEEGGYIATYSRVFDDQWSSYGDIKIIPGEQIKLAFFAQIDKPYGSGYYEMKPTEFIEAAAAIGESVEGLLIYCIFV